MDWNAITTTVESQLAEQEQELVAEEQELARRRAALRKRRGALRARRRAFEQCHAIWASIDSRLETDDVAAGSDPVGDPLGGEASVVSAGSDR